LPDVTLRPIDDSDLDALFDQMRDLVPVQMAAFTTQDPDDRETFDSRMAKSRTAPDATTRAVICDGRLVGSIASFVVEGETEITYWIDRSVWGRGIGRRAVALLLDTVGVRPVYARAASDNVGSLKVLQGRASGSSAERPRTRTRGAGTSRRPSCASPSASTA
jgi:RimJ/RimL family protein N-acetyltransferase